MHRGARVVVRAPGVRLDYQVARVRPLSKAALARHARWLFAQDAPGRLVLVTCEDWDGTGYRSNVVVTARLVRTTVGARRS